MWALIKNGVVAETTSIDPAGRFHESYVWVKCSKDVAYGWVYDGVRFSPPIPEQKDAATSCTTAQGLVALFAIKGITEDQILEAISQIPDPVQQYTAKIGYQRATIWERDSPTMKTIAGLLHLTDSDIDALFAKAVTVQV